MSCNIYSYAVLAIVSNSYPPLPGRLPTRYSPVRNSSREASSSFSVLLACIRHAASVRPEPGSNSHFKKFEWLLIPYLRSLSQIYCLRIDFASCLGFYTRTLLAKLCSVFKVLPLSCFFVKQTAFIFYQTIISLSRTFLICFFSSCSSFFCFHLTTFKYITSLFTSLQVLFFFLFVFFPYMSVFKLSSHLSKRLY